MAQKHKVGSKKNDVMFAYLTWFLQQKSHIRILFGHPSLNIFWKNRFGLKKLKERCIEKERWIGEGAKKNDGLRKNDGLGKVPKRTMD